MTAGVIAAGWGRRLGGGPKALARIGDRPLIDLVLEGLTSAGVDRVVCVVNETSTIVCDYVRGAWPDLAVDWIVRTTPSSMHSFLLVIERLAESGGESCLVTTVDSVGPHGTVPAFVHRARSLVGALTLGVTRHVDDEKPLYAVPRDPAVDGSVAFELAELSSLPAASPFVTAGLYWVSPVVLEERAHALSAGFTALRQFLGRVVASGRTCWAVPLPPMVDVDRPEDVEAAARLTCHGFVTF